MDTDPLGELTPEDAARAATSFIRAALISALTPPRRAECLHGVMDMDPLGELTPEDAARDTASFTLPAPP